MDDLLDADDHTIARRMNEESRFSSSRIPSNMLDLKLLKTRKPGNRALSAQELFAAKGSSACHLPGPATQRANEPAGS
jgi:hypothetical protein